MMASVLGGTDTEEGRAVILKAIPMGRVAEAKDVANAAAFLASDEASFITVSVPPGKMSRSTNERRRALSYLLTEGER